MARYYFHFKRGDAVEIDAEGIELADLLLAAREAVKCPGAPGRSDQSSKGNLFC